MKILASRADTATVPSEIIGAGPDAASTEPTYVVAPTGRLTYRDAEQACAGRPLDIAMTDAPDDYPLHRAIFETAVPDSDVGELPVRRVGAMAGYTRRER